MNPREAVGIILLFSLSFAIAFLVGAEITGWTPGGTRNILLEPDMNPISEDVPYKPKYGMDPVWNLTDNKLIIEGNRSFEGWADDIGEPPFWVRINSRGFRDEKFNTTPPNDTVRILVVGSSFTFGKGVNESDRFTEVAERKLNAAVADKTVQIINAGTAGWGMREFYYFLEMRGLEYEPDVVVVSFGGAKISKKRQVELHNEVRRELDLGENLSQEQRLRKIREALRRKKIAIWQEMTENVTTLQNSAMANYASEIVRSVRETGADIIFYSLLPRGDTEKRFWQRWSERHNVSVLFPPEKYRRKWRSGEYRIGGRGTHPTAEAHQDLGRRLSEELENRYLSR
ncbi:MAG: SGNH/GDSL hydrolase family protein [Candidatus Nanohaloarchaea archaeon]